MASKWVDFAPSEYKATAARPAWRVDSKKGGYEIGYIYYDLKWRKYCLKPVDGIVFDATCLRDIADFVGGCNVREGE